MDHDRLFKELLTTFFTEFVELFLPDVSSYIEPGSVEFLDKEIFTDVAKGGRHEVDLLVKVRFRNHGEGYFLIHVELQASPQSDFPHRIFGYFSRLDQKFSPLKVFPVAMFTYDKPRRAEADRYVVEFPWQRVLDFNFRTIQLNRLDWRDFLRHPNPVASALMTRMQIAPEDRPRVKLECLRMLVTLKLDKARATLISAFMEAYLKLTPTEMAVYNREVETIEPKEREAVMQWTNEWIEEGKAQGLNEGLARGRDEGLARGRDEGLAKGRDEGLAKGRDEGLAKGRDEGRSEGRRAVVRRLLDRQLGTSAANQLAASLERLTESQLDDLALALFDFHSLADAQAWFVRVAG